VKRKVAFVRATPVRAGLDWISVQDRLPLDRRPVWAWGYQMFLGFKGSPGPLGVARVSCDGGEYQFDIERRRSMIKKWTVVTHWAEIVGPQG